MTIITGTNDERAHHRDIRRGIESKVPAVHLAADTFNLLLQSSRAAASQISPVVSAEMRRLCRTYGRRLYLIEISNRKTRSCANRANLCRVKGKAERENESNVFELFLIVG